MLVADAIVANEGDKVTAFSTEASECGIYKVVSGIWTKQYPPSTEQISEAWPDIIWAVNNGYPASGTASEKIQAYTGPGVTYFEMLAANRAFIDSLASNNIHVLTSGSLYGGDRFDEDGNIVSSGVDGWWFGAGENVGFKARGKVLDFTFCKPDGTVVGQINADNILFDTEDYNTSLGYYGIPYNATGDNNVALGYGCLTNLDDGERNVAIGTKALYKSIDGDDNIAIGNEALTSISGSTLGNYQNIAIGTEAMSEATNGTLYSVNSNIAIGGLALQKAHSGLNIAIGYSAMRGDNDGSGVLQPYNLAIGFYAGSKFKNAVGNTVVGTQALYRAYNPWYSTAIGYNAMSNRNNSSSCVAIGANALAGSDGDTDTCTDCVAIGDSALLRGGTPNGCVAIGSYATASGVGSYNTAIGYYAGKNIESNSYNTIVGYRALSESITAEKSVAIGFYALIYAQRYGNTALGYNAGGATVSGYYNTYLGDDAGDEVVDEHNITALGYNAQITGSNQVQLGNSSTTVYAYGAVQNRSDIRDKTDIRDTILGLDFVTKLHPVDFRWDYREDYIESVVTEEEVINEDGTKSVIKKTEKIVTPKDGSKKRKRYHHGFIAQEVKQTIDDLGVDFGGYQNHSLNGGKDVLSIGYSELVAPMIKAIQEQNEIIKKLEARIVVLESKNLTAN